MGYYNIGGKNCPATWARASDWVMKSPDLIKYVDDIAIASRTEEEHIHAIKMMFDKITKHNLKLKYQNVNSLKKDIEFVGHTIS